MIQKDDWEKPRSKGQHLTPAEITFIKLEYRKGSKIQDTARTLKCSSRVVAKYYGFFKAEGTVKNTERPYREFAPVKPGPRFYKSNFEL